MKSYLEYLQSGNKSNWLIKPIDVNKHPVKSSWTAIFSDLFKKSKDDNEKNSIESNKTTSDNSSQSGNNRVVYINVDNEHPNHQGSVGRIKYYITTQYNS